MALPRLQWPLVFDGREPDFDPPGVIPGWLPRMADRVAWVLIFSLMYFLWLWTLEIAGDRATPLQISKAGVWTFNANFYWPLLIGFLASAIGLPMLAKIGIPIYCELSYKKPGQGWPKFWTLVLIILTSFVLIAGNLHVINGARLEKNRDGAVKLEQVDQGRAALQANLDSVNADLKDITNPALTTYQAQAAREGAAAWAKRVATAKAQNDWQADAIERALASAERGDQLRADRAKAIQALAAAPTRAANVDRVVKEGDWATNITDELDKARALMLSVVQDLAALLLGWIAYRLDAVRKQQLADWEAVHSEPVAEAGIDLRLEDQTDTAQPMPQESIWEEDPATGELVEKIRMRRKKEEWFVTKTPRKPRKKKTDPRAPVENELSSEDGTGEDIPGADQSRMVQNGTGAEYEDISGDADRSGISGSAGLRDEGLEATRTAYESSFEGQGQDEVDDGSSLQKMGPETLQNGLDGAGVDQPNDDDLLDAQADQAGTEGISEFVQVGETVSGPEGIDAPLQAPDEQITWEQEDEQTEPQEPEDHDPQTAETPLPNGEGVLVRAAE